MKKNKLINLSFKNPALSKKKILKKTRIDPKDLFIDSSSTTDFISRPDLSDYCNVKDFFSKNENK